MNVIELRNYLLKPGARDKFIEYFKDHFLESQNVLGADTPEQFRIKGEDDRFFWIRGFSNMKERGKFLRAFYDGQVWKEFGPAANYMMLEWHNVHLLKPVSVNTIEFDKKQKLLVIDYYTTVNNQRDQLIDLFTQNYLPVYNKSGINNISLWVSEMAVNDFPGLPVYQQENLLVVITGYNSEVEYKSVTDRSDAIKKKIDSNINELVETRNSLILYPAY
ncbi:MAG: hypothetical protein ABI675_05865 [Chitinophagaceae bacterium]